MKLGFNILCYFACGALSLVQHQPVGPAVAQRRTFLALTPRTVGISDGVVSSSAQKSIEHSGATISQPPSFDSPLSMLPDLSLVPDTSIATFDGQVNLGALLWSTLLYFLLRDALTPTIAALAGETDSSWLRDYQEGIQYEMSPKATAVRAALILALGTLCNLGWISLLDGDSFWGWSTGACLCIPAGLFSAAGQTRPSRAEATVAQEIFEAFAEFSTYRIRGIDGRRVEEARLVRAFRQALLKYRRPEDYPDPVIVSAIRRKLGCRPDPEGYYRGIAYSDGTREMLAARQARIDQLQEEKEAALAAVAVGKSAAGDEGDGEEDSFMNDFSRR